MMAAKFIGTDPSGSFGRGQLLHFCALIARAARDNTVWRAGLVAAAQALISPTIWRSRSRSASRFRHAPATVPQSGRPAAQGLTQRLRR
jgi:hypothetical protein